MIARHLRFLDTCRTVQTSDDIRRAMSDLSGEVDSIEAESARLEADSYTAVDPLPRRNVADGADALKERVYRIEVRLALIGETLRDCPPATPSGTEARTESSNAKVHVSVLAMSEGCPNDGILPDQGYVAPFSGVLVDIGRCHTSAEPENSVSVKLDPAGGVQAFEVVKGNGACLEAAVKKVRFPSHRCAATLLIVSAPGPAAP